MASPRIGIHVRTGRGLDRAADTIRTLGLGAAALFTGNPSAWRSATVDPQATARFREAMRAMDVHVYSHAMYLINLASPNPTFYSKSKAALAEELRRAESYGCVAAVTHVGSHMGEGREAGIERVVKAIDEVLKSATNEIGCLLEISAGGGAYVGSRFEDLATIMDRLPQHSGRLGVCFDTAHAYASGYDLAGAQGMRQTLDELVRQIPAHRIRACHCNDTSVACGGKADRHENIGRGNLGLDAFQTLLAYAPLQHCAFILETPGEELLEGLENLNTLRSLV
jgi:deoxyribonuclease-4